MHAALVECSSYQFCLGRSTPSHVPGMEAAVRLEERDSRQPVGIAHFRQVWQAYEALREKVALLGGFQEIPLNFKF